MTIEEHLAVPYILCMESFEHPSGEWLRRAWYPELPGCVAEAFSPIEAINALDERREQIIRERLASGQPIPVPRPPLQSALRAVDPNRMHFGRYLVDQGHVRE
jgi:hypothetical protein